MRLRLILLGLGLIFGIGRHQVRSLEDSAARELAGKLGGALRQVSVRTEPTWILSGLWGDMRSVTIEAAKFSTVGLPFFTEPERSTKGKVRELKLVLDDFRLGTLQVEHLDAEIPDCRFDFDLAARKRTFRLSKSGLGSGRVRIQERPLEEFILKKFHEIKSVHVDILDGKVLVTGYGEFLVISTNFSVEASLSSPDGSKINLVEATVLFDKRPAGASGTEVLLKTLNPVVDLQQDLGLLDTIFVQGIELKNDRLEAWGKAKIPTKPR